MIDALVAGLFFGLVVALLAGTVARYVMESAAHRGLGVAMVASSGVAVADGFWAAAAMAAMSLLGRAIEPWVGYLQWAAVAVLAGVLVLTVRNMTQGVGPDSFGEFLSHTLVHPATIIIFGSLAIGTATHYSPIQAAAFVAGVFVASLLWQWTLAIAGARRGRGFSERARRNFVVFDCVMLIVLIVYMAFGLYRIP